MRLGRCNENRGIAGVIATASRPAWCYSAASKRLVTDPSSKTSWIAWLISGAMEKIGDISEPVVGSYGVHILQYVRDVPSGAVELDTDLKESLRAELLSSKQQETFNAAITKWMDEANIVYTDAGLDIMPTTVDNAE